MSLDLQVNKNLTGYKVHTIEAYNDGDLCNCIITRELLLEDEYNHSKIKLFDVGADQGGWALMALYFQPKAEILCFEPNKFTFEQSKKLSETFPTLTWYNVAISDSHGSLQLVTDGSHSNSRDITESTNVQTVEKWPIQSFLLPKDFITLVKIDTEGHDIIILRNMLPLVKEKKIGSIITEFTVYWYGNSKEECLQNSIDILKEYSKHYMYTYFLSRRGPPHLYCISAETIPGFCKELYSEHVQADVCFTNRQFGSLPVKVYIPPEP